MATYGEGDPTDNSQEFHEWLQNDRDDLEGLNFAVSKTTDLEYFLQINVWVKSKCEHPLVIIPGKPWAFRDHGATLRLGGITEYWGGGHNTLFLTRSLLTLYNFKNIGGGHVPPLPPYSAIPGNWPQSSFKWLEIWCIVESQSLSIWNQK